VGARSSTSPTPVTEQLRPGEDQAEVITAQKEHHSPKKRLEATRKYSPEEETQTSNTKLAR
jgi:hypothetical protein